MANMIQLDRSDIFSAARKLVYVGGSIVTLIMQAALIVAASVALSTLTVVLAVDLGVL